MDARRKIEIAVFVAALCLVAFFVYQWHSADIAQATAQAKTETLEQAVKQTQQTLDALNREIQDRDKSMQAMQQQFALQIAAIRTPQQAQPIILKYAQDNLPAGSVTATVDPNTGAAKYELTPEAVTQLGKDITVCQQNSALLGECQHQVVDLKSEVTGLTTQRDAYKQEAAEWKKAAKGTFWSRTKKGLKYMAIGGGIALAVTCGTGHCQ